MAEFSFVDEWLKKTLTSTIVELYVTSKGQFESIFLEGEKELKNKK